MTDTTRKVLVVTPVAVALLIFVATLMLGRKR